MRVYVLFFHADPKGGHVIYPPIKRVGYPYAGMPQFFGGDVNPGETAYQALAREVGEESDKRLKFPKDSKREIHRATVSGQVLVFYISDSFEGSNSLGDLKTGEMASIQKVYIPESDPDYGIDDMLTALRIKPSEDFARSETYVAFEKAIALLRT